MKRNIIQIDEEKCNGCGQCITSCAECALQIVDGKAKLVKEIYCDGLGACLGTCPTGALTIVQRDTDAFDEEKTKEHIYKTKMSEVKACSCPSSIVMDIASRDTASNTNVAAETKPELTSWPVQLMLVPVTAPYFAGADILLAADCTAFSTANFHSRFIKGKKLIIACPKLDNADFYVDKLTQIFANNSIKSISVLRMEVPCCGGLTHIVKKALAESGKNIPYNEKIIGIKGEVLSGD